ncbi:hypothetical protein TNCV_1192581 [Trichonephila clavipes]|nr:hypothetical protein TNCV_1192581 [Trichonephila clavipes]
MFTVLTVLLFFTVLTNIPHSPDRVSCNINSPHNPHRGRAPYFVGLWTATAGSDVVQSGRPIFDDFFQHLWPYIGNNTANVIFQMVKRLWLIRIDQ